jgi:hypothetical protein
VALEPGSAYAVARCIGRRRSEPVFTGPPRGGQVQRLSRFGADHLLKRLETSGPALTANALRRFHITSQHAAGVDLDTVRIRAGVDDLRTLRRYLESPTDR